MPAGNNNQSAVQNGPHSPNATQNSLDKMNLSAEHVYTRPKPGWRPSKPDTEEAIPSDSLYNGGQNGGQSWREKQFGSRPSLNGMAHWSSHGYLAKANENTMPNGPTMENGYNQSNGNSGLVSPGHNQMNSPPNGPHDGYVVLRKQGDQLVTGPQSLPVHNNPGERKYYSVKGYDSMIMNDPKYLSMDPRYHSLKNLPPEIRARLRDNLRQVQQQETNGYQPVPPVKPVQQMPSQVMMTTQQQFAPAPPPRNDRNTMHNNQNNTNQNGTKNSVSWQEWTQQLQAYIAWVNSQLRKRPELRPVQDLRTDLQSGEVLAQLIEIICKYFYLFTTPCAVLVILTNFLLLQLEKRLLASNMLQNRCKA